MNNTEREMMFTEYSGRPIVPIVIAVLFICAVIVAGTHLFMYLISKL